MDNTTPNQTAPVEIRSAKEMLKVLRAAFPVFAEFKPLAIGIDKQVMAIHPEFEKKLLRPAMGFHTGSISYLKAMQNASNRFNLDGTPADPVTAEQRDHAAQQLREHFKAGAEKRRAEKAAAEAAAAEAAAEAERTRKLEALASKFGRK